MNALQGRVRSKLVIGTLVGLLVLTALVGSTGMARAQEGTPTPGATGASTVTVSGQGTVSLPPDTASIVIGVDVTRPTLTEAQAAASDQMAAVLTALRDEGVADEDIQTVNYSVYVLRNYDQQTGTPTEITGYQVTNQVNVTVRDVDAVGDLLDAVVDAGANNIYGIYFYVDDESEPAKQARTLAVEDARAKAEQLAAAAGMTLGRVVSITETFGPPAVPLPYKESMSAQDASGRAGPGIETGSTEISVDVTITFELV